MQLIGDHPEEWGKHYELTADIDLSGYTGTQFNIIGNEAIKFSGVFDGNGHTISNFTYTCTGTDNIGIFGYVSGNDAEIKNLSLVNPYVDAGTGCRVGCLSGYLCDGTIANCHIEGGGVIGGSGSFSEVGRLVGFNIGGKLINCSVEEGYVYGNGECVGGLVGYSKGEITDCCATTSEIWAAGDRVGGLVGYSEGEVTNCYAATTNVWATADRVGGLIGENGWSDTITGIVSNCSAGGEVTGDQLVGGLVGYNKGEIYNSYAIGRVSGDSAIGGLVGINQDDSVIRGLISECYSIGPVSGNNRVGGLVGDNSGRIYYSHAMGSVSGTGDGSEDLGGLAGRNAIERAIISNCYAMGDVTEGGSRVGGLVGLNSEARIRRCYSTGSISGNSKIGGLVGRSMNGGIVDYSFWDVDRSGLDTSDGGTGKTTAEMMTESTFTDYGWDFTTPVWMMCYCGGNYPRFWWEEPRVYYVNAADGNDSNHGLRPESAFAAIQAGIDAAYGCETVLVQPGEYAEGIAFSGYPIILTSIDPVDPNIIDDTVIRGSVQFSGAESPDCTFAGFKIDEINFGVIIGNGTHAMINHCIISGNSPCGGTAINNCDGIISNCLVTDYSAGGCGQSYVINRCNGLIKNCTIVNNVSGVGDLFGGSMTIENCIIYNNGSGSDSQIDIFGGGVLDISYSNIQGGIDGIDGDGTVDWGLGNINIDPCFVDDANGDYHLKSYGWRWDKENTEPGWEYWYRDAVTSRCIDAGNPGSPLGNELMTVPPDPLNEYGINLRINMGFFGGTSQASMPPYGWALLSDLSNDGLVDYVDLAGQIEDWLTNASEPHGDLNRDGIVNMKDFATLAEDWLQTTDWAE
jgi:hypothetical protein